MARKAAVITGSATGVGAATARMLAGKGWNVAINYTKSQKEAGEVSAACEKLGADTIVVQADVASDADCRRLVDDAVKKFGRLDALVNSAGTTKFVNHKDLDGLSAEDFARIFAVNTTGPYLMARAAAPHLKKSGKAAIVNVSSLGGLRGSGSSIAYGASKAALNALTMSLGRVLGPEIRVNAVCPAFIQGRWLKDNLGEELYEQMKKQAEANNPLKMAPTPEDVAEHIVWLIEGAHLMTGQIISIDAGQSIAGPTGHTPAKKPEAATAR